MRRTHDRGTKARPGLSAGAHAPVNVTDSMEEMNVGGEKRRKWHSRNVCCAVLRYISYSSFRKSSLGLPSPFGPRNSPSTGILHAVRHVYRSVWPAREAKPRFGATLCAWLKLADTVQRLHLTEGTYPNHPILVFPLWTCSSDVVLDPLSVLWVVFHCRHHYWSFFFVWYRRLCQQCRG